MVGANSPFQDTELFAALQQHGVVHKPGMAVQYMQEIAPLLKAEGIDVNDPDGSNPNLTLAQINEAMARATEQSNLSLFTPVGRDRMNALTLLRRTAWCVSVGKIEEAMRILDIVAPEETEMVPAGSHMIGVSLGLLDSWLSGAEAAKELPVVLVPKFRGKTPAIARDLIALARKKRAFDTRSRFIVQHGGEELMRGGAFAVSATVAQIALRDRVSIHQTFEGLEYALEVPGLCPVAYRSIDVRSEAAQASDYEWKERYADWIDDGVVPEEEVHEVLDQLDELTERALARRIDIHEPHGMAEMIDVVERTRVGYARFFDYELLDSYARFRQYEAGFGASSADTTSETPGALWWNLAAEINSRMAPYFEAAAQDATAGVSSETYYVGLEDPDWTEDQRFELDALLDNSPVVAGLFDVIEWLENRDR